MGRVPEITKRVPQEKVGMPMPDRNMGQFEIAQKGKVGQAIAGAVGEFGGMIQSYVDAGRKTDIEADEAAFSLYAKDRMTAANDAARRTQDLGQVDQIYLDAEADIESYIGDKNGAGTPNVRWRDHQEDLRNKIEPMKGRIREVATGRKFDIYQADKVAKIDNVMLSAADEDGINEAASLMKESGLYGTEEINLAKKNQGSLIVQMSKRVEIEEAKRQYLEDGDSDAYIKALDDIDTGGMVPKHGRPLEYEIMAKQNNIRGKVVKQMTTISDDIFEKLATDELESSDMAQLYNDNPELATALDKSSKAKLKEGVAAGNEKAIAAQKALDDMVSDSSPESWAGAVRRIGDLNSSYGVLALFAANSYAKEIVSTQDTLVAYEALWSRHKDYKLSVDDNTKDYIHTMSYYMKRKSDGHGDFLNSKLRAFSKWQKDPEDKSYADFRKEQFGKDAERDVQQLYAPQLNVPRGTTKYKDGDTRTHPKTGVTYTMKDGKWQK